MPKSNKEKTMPKNKNISLDSLKHLESKGAFIHTGYDHYENGSNLLFSIEFRKNNKRIYQTGWYGDNHEWGDSSRTMKCAIKYAYFILDNPELMQDFNMDDDNGLEQKREDFIWNLTTDEYKKSMEEIPRENT